MKRLAYSINAFFVILLSKSVVFANELESESNYLVELAKNNISMANSWMSLLRVLTTVFALAFITVIIFIVAQLYRLAKQISANKEVLQTIEKHGESLTILARDTEEIRNQIRDQNLMAKGIKEEDYGNFLKEVLKREATPPNMNMIRNLVWTLFKPEEYESGLEKLGKIFGDPGTPPLMKKIREVYFEILEETISQNKLLTWVYEIKENDKEIEELIKEELKAKIRIEEGRKKFFENLPPLYPERTLSRLEQTLKDLLKEMKSGE